MNFNCHIPSLKLYLGARVIIHQYFMLYIHVRMGKNCIIREVFFFQMKINNSHQTKKHIRLRFLFDNGA